MTAGRADLLMATYLPYCHQFITADDPQADNLHEVVVEAKIDCEVVEFSKFTGRFSVFHAR